MMGFAPRQLGYCSIAAVLWVFSIPRVFWPYLAGSAILLIGLLTAIRSEARRAKELDKVAQFGPLFFAIAMAIFGADHFIAAKFVAQTVPSWIPWHLFWAYFVGAALIAAALSLAANKQSWLAGMLLGIMIFLFVCLIHVPALFATPHDKTRLTIFLRDLALSVAALSFAASRRDKWRPQVANPIVAIARILIGITVAVFGFEHFLFPHAAPGIPQENPAGAISMPSWIPGHVIWAYVTGAILIACGLGLLAAKRSARFAASALGCTLLLLTLFVYLPLVIAKPSDIGNALNYLAIHLALAGAALLLASALPRRVPAETVATKTERVELHQVSES
jgi:uncharacterized membrane protein